MSKVSKLASATCVED